MEFADELKISSNTVLFFLRTTYIICNIQESVGTEQQCYGSGMFIPDPNFSIPDPRSWIRIRIKEFKYF
jgi:hypothetical protein